MGHSSVACYPAWDTSVQSWLELPLSRDSKLYSSLGFPLSPLPVLARSAASPCPETGKPGGPQGRVRVSLPKPRSPRVPRSSAVSPLPLQPLDLFTVVSHLLEGHQKLPIMQKKS